MSVAGFRKMAAELGWSCSPKSGTDKEGSISVGLNEFNFYNNRLYTVYIGDPAFSTEKGLRVGDSMAKVRRLYGEPGSKYGVPDSAVTGYGYTLSEMVGMDVWIEAGKVVEILLGWPGHE